MQIKPDTPTLFHGSGTRGLTLIHPRQESIRDVYEGLVIFASSKLRLACMFMSPSTRDSWTRKGSFGDVYYYVISDEKRFRDGDKGGSIYEVPSDTFYRVEGKGMSTEFISQVEVSVVKERDFDSTLDALLWCGVQVYFVTQEEFEKFGKSWEEGLALLKTLTSENQKQNKNIQSFI